METVVLAADFNRDGVPDVLLRGISWGAVAREVLDENTRRAGGCQRDGRRANGRGEANYQNGCNGMDATERNICKVLNRSRMVRIFSSVLICLTDS
jgi:hypothetical protein